MKKGRLVLAVLVLAATSTLLVSGSLPVAGAGSGASMAEGGHANVARISASYMKVASD